MLHVHTQLNPLAPGSRQTELVPWRPGVTVQDVAPGWADAGQDLASLNSEDLAGDWQREVADGDHLNFFPATGIPLATFVAAYGQVIGFLAFVGVNTGIALVVGRIIAAIVGGDPPKPIAPGDQSSGTFGAFRGPISRRQNGMPVPVVYGRARTGGIVIHEFVEAFGGSSQTYRIELLLSAGPVQAIGTYTADQDTITGASNVKALGLLIDDQPADNYAGAIAWVRTGGNDQLAIPAFADTTTQLAVGFDLDVSPSPENLPTAPGVYTALQVSALATDWQEAVSHTMTTEADRFVVRIGWLRGLFDVDTGSGGFIPAESQLQIRYVEVDGGGSPTGDYVILPAHTVAAKITSPFYRDFEHAFSTTAGYAAPSVGLCADFDGSNDSARATSVDASWPVNSQIRDFSIAAWVNLDDNQNGNFIAHWVSALEGFSFGLRVGSTTSFVRIRLRLRNAVGYTVFDSDDIAWGVFDQTWRHVAALFTFNDGVAATHFVEFLVDGVIIKTLVTQDTFQYAGLGDSYYMGENGAGPSTATRFSGRVDDCAWWKRTLGVGEVLDLATLEDTLGNHIGSPDTTDPDLVAYWSCNSEDPAGSIKADVGGTPLVLQSGAALVSPGKVFASPESVTPKNGKFKIEVVLCDTELSADVGEDKATWTDVLLVQDQAFSHPGSAKVALQVFDPDQFGGSRPEFSVLVAGRLVKVWDGASTISPNFVVQWSRNPAWVAMDVLTDEEYGTGRVYTTKEIDLPAFLAWANYCDELVDDLRGTVVTTATLSYSSSQVTIAVAVGHPNHWVVGYALSIDGTSSDWDTEATLGLTIVSVTDDGTDATFICTWPASQDAPVDAAPTAGNANVEGRDVRFRFDGVFDRAGVSAWDVAREVCRVGRAIPLRIGGTVSVFYDHPRTAVDKVGMAAIAPEPMFTRSWGGLVDKPNSIDIEFSNELLDHRPDFVTVDHPNVQDPTQSVSFVKARIRLPGVTREMQALRYGRYFLNVLQELRDSVHFATGVQGLNWLPGDIVEVSHDFPYKLGSSGRVWEDATSLTVVKLDVDFEFESGSTYEFEVISSGNGERASVAVDASMIPSSTTAGDAITLAASLPYLPMKHDLFSLGETGEASKDYSCVELQLDPKTMRRTVRMVEYQASVYDDDPATEVEALKFATSSLQLDPQRRQAARARNLTLSDNSELAAGGGGKPGIEVSWELEREGADITDRIAIWYREVNATSPREWEAVGTAGGRTESFTLAGAVLRVGTEYEVAVQPITTGGRRRSIRHCLRGTVTFYGWGRQPPAPTNAALNLRGDLGVYSWDQTPLAARMTQATEGRVGGWVLGQRVFSVDPQALHSPPVEGWLNVAANSEGDTAPPVYICNRSGSGMVSNHASITVAREPIGSTVLSQDSLEDVWTTGSPAPILTDLQVDSTYAPPALKWSGSATTGSYVSTEFDLGTAERVDVQVFVEAYQRHPKAWEDMDFTWGSVEAQRFSWEGWRVLASDESEVTLALEWAYSDTGSPGSDWQPFQPGRVFMRSAIFRLSLTRPDSTFDVRIRRLGYRMTQPGPHEATVGDGGTW